MKGVVTEKSRARIGNRRSQCETCNTFAQNVRRLALKQFMETHNEEYQKIRLRIELDLYPQVLEEFSARYGIFHRQEQGEDAQ